MDSKKEEAMNSENPTAPEAPPPNTGYSNLGFVSYESII
jgi:hypothetical protein